MERAAQAAGLNAPRDTDMQEKAIGEAFPVTDDLSHLQRGDLVFWKGHVGIMTDPETLLHATAYCGIPAGLDAFKATHEVLLAEGAIPGKK